MIDNAARVTYIIDVSTGIDGTFRVRLGNGYDSGTRSERAGVIYGNRERPGL